MRNPKETAPLLARYELLSVLTGQMRHAAGAGQWGTVAQLEAQRQDLVAHLRPLDAGTSLSPAAGRHKQNLLDKMLREDAETRQLIEAEMGDLRNRMQSSHQEVSLRQAYGL